MDKKYILLNEITGAILKSSDDWEEINDFALIEHSKRKNETIIIKESSTDFVMKSFGLLLD